jgi:surface protein
MIDAVNGSWLQTISEQLNFGVVNGSWIQGWAESLGIIEPVNGSWELAIIDYLNIDEVPNYGLGSNTIQTLCGLYGVFQPLNGSWIQALAQMIYDSYTNPHISEWRTTVPNETITLPYTLNTANGGYNGIIDWGDGTTSVNFYANRTHTYATPGYYNITIYGRVRGFRFNNGGDKNKIYRILSWGSGFNLGVGGGQFYGCTNLNLSEVSDVLQVYAPGQSLGGQTRNWANMFRDCTSLTTINRINEWDMSNVTTLFACFGFCTNFNSDISNWDVSSCANFQSLFLNCTNFNQDIGNWDVSSATSMFATFQNAFAFNQDISHWNISNVTIFTNFMRNKTFLNYTTENYDNLLIGWASRPVKPNQNIHFGTIKRTSLSTAAKSILTSAPNNWTIVDGGLV